MKEALASSAVLAFQEENGELSVATDVSATAVRAVLQQRRWPREDWRPLGFFSKKLESTQLVYSTLYRELFAIFAIFKKAASSLSGLITAPSSSPSSSKGETRRPYIRGSCPSFLSSPTARCTSLAKKMLWPIFSPGPLGRSPHTRVGQLGPPLLLSSGSTGHLQRFQRQFCSQQQLIWSPLRPRRDLAPLPQNYCGNLY